MLSHRLVALALAAAAAAPIARHASRAVDAIDIGVEDAAAPWSQADGTGYANDVVVASFRAAGIDAHLIVLPYARCKQMVMAGTIAACFSMSDATELRGAVQFSAQPLFTYSSDFFTRADRARSQSIEDLPPGAIVGTVLGYEYPDAILTRLAKRQILTERAESEISNLRKLAAGRIAAAIVNVNEVKPANWVIAQAGVEGRVVRAFGLGPTPSFIGFSSAHPRGREIATRYDEGFRRITSSGELKRIRERWIARARPGTPP